MPGKVESSKSRPWGNERSEIGKSTGFGKGGRDTADFSFLTTAMGANVEVELAKSRRQGNERSEVGSEESNPAMNRFTGKPYDEDLQAYVFPFRNYSTKLARWTSVDPAGFPDGPNRHFYAPVPTSGLDPMGLEEDPEPWIRSGTYSPWLVFVSAFPEDNDPVNNTHPDFDVFKNPPYVEFRDGSFSAPSGASGAAIQSKTEDLDWSIPLEVQPPEGYSYVGYYVTNVSTSTSYSYNAEVLGEDVKYWTGTTNFSFDIDMVYEEI